jgi:hypothetical protein
MGTVFGVPCPECGGQMMVESDGDLECPACRRQYHVRMGHLFPVGQPPPARITSPAVTSPAAPAQP